MGKNSSSLFVIVTIILLIITTATSATIAQEASQNKAYVEKTDNIINTLAGKDSSYAASMTGACLPIKEFIDKETGMLEAIAGHEKRLEELTLELSIVSQNLKELGLAEDEQYIQLAVVSEIIKDIEFKIDSSDDPDKASALEKDLAHQQDIRKGILDELKQIHNQIKDHEINQIPEINKGISDTQNAIAFGKKELEKLRSAQPKPINRNPSRIIAYAIDPNDPNHVIACNNHPNCNFPAGAQVKLLQPRA